MIRRMSRDRFLSDEELERFMAAVRERRHVHQPRDYALFALLSATGLRPSEALALRIDDLHLSGPKPWLRVRRLKKKAAEVYDELQIPDTVAAILRTFIATPGREPGTTVFRLHRRSAQRLFRHYAHKAGLHPRFYLYCLRHTAATRIYRTTRDIRIVQAVLGHDSPDTSCIYAHVARQMLRQHADTLPAAL